jgi:hypothetical protein
VWYLIAEHQRIGQINTAESPFKNHRGLTISLYLERNGEDTDYLTLRTFMKKAATLEGRRNQITHSHWAAGKDPQSITRIKTTAKEKLYDMKGECQMSKNRRLTWLRNILAVKIALILFVWGLPALLAPISLLQRLGVPTPDDPIYLRLFGAVVIAFGVAYWYAYKDPIHNIAILKAGIVDNGLATLVTLFFIVFHGLRSIMMLISTPLTLFFFISFILLMPKTEAA